MKIYNMMFMEAGASFSSLRIYYDHLVELLRQASERMRVAGERTEAEYKKKHKEYDKQYWAKFRNVFAEVYPGYFHNSFLISACSLFEHQAKKLCMLIQEEHSVPVEWDDMEGSVPKKTKRFLRLAGVALHDDPPRVVLPPPDFAPVNVYDENRTIIRALWTELEYYYRLRNCIVHDNSLVRKARGAVRLQEYATEKSIVIDSEGEPELRLNKEFNKNVCDTMETFFQRLMSAYYSTPLPEKAE